GSSSMTGAGDRGMSRSDVNYVPPSSGTFSNASSLPATPTKSTNNDSMRPQGDFQPANDQPVARTGGASTVAPIHDVSSQPAVHSGPMVNEAPMTPPPPPGPPEAASSAQPLPPIGTGSGSAPEMPSPPPAPAVN